MNKLKAKWAAFLMAISCFFVCFGIGVQTIDKSSQTTTITASASATYTLRTIAATNASTSSVLYVYALDGDALEVNSWDYTFTLASGTGFTWNGTPFTPTTMKQPGTDCYIELGKTAQAGDVVGINGTFTSSQTSAKIIFKNCLLEYDGSAWKPALKSENIGKLNLHVNSSVGAASSQNDALYLERADDNALPVLTWAYTFKAEGDSAFKINGTAVALPEMKSTGDGLYIKLGKAFAANDYVTLGGTFYCEELNTRYTIETSSFLWDGSGWKAYTDYTTHTLGKLSFKQMHPGNTKMSYFVRADGEKIPVTSTENDVHWETAFKIVQGSGIGVTIDGTGVNYVIKFTGDVFVELAITPYKGAIMRIGGTFYDQPLATKYVIEESAFQFNGTTWEEYVQYTTHDLGTLSFKEMHPGALNMAYFVTADGRDLPSASTNNDLLWNTPFSLVEGSGVGVTINGTAVNYTLKFPGDAFVELVSAPQKGDIMVISGRFYAKSLATEYIIRESSFKFNGTTWEMYRPITNVNIGSLSLHAYSTPGGAYANQSQNLYLKRSDGKALPILNASYSFDEYSEGAFKINGANATYTSLKSTTNGLIFTFGRELNAGEVVTINGNFCCESLSTEYTIEESSFRWTGSSWEKYVATNAEYSTLAIAATSSSTASAVYIYPVGGEFPSGNDAYWTMLYSFVEGSGAGMSLGGATLTTTDIKLPGTDFYINLGKSAKEGDIFTIDGAFYNGVSKIKLIFDNCAIQWNGSAWVTYTEKPEVAPENMYNLGGLTFDMMQPDNNKMAYFHRADGTAFPAISDVNTLWETPFTCAAGGVTLNGKAITPVVIKFPNAAFFEFSFTPSNGDVLSIGGDFYCEAFGVNYTISRSAFVWNGSAWVDYTAYNVFSLSVVPGESTVSNLYLNPVEGDSLTMNDWEEGFTLLSGAGCTWNGVSFKPVNIKQPGANVFVETGKTAKAGDIFTIEGSYISNTLKAVINLPYAAFQYDGSVWGPFKGIAVTYTTSAGTVVEYAKVGEVYTFPQGKTFSTFIAWTADGKVYKAGDSIEVNQEMSFTAIELDFTLEAGAAIRITTNADTSGIRFTTYINEAQLNALQTYGITIIEYGTLIVPYDYLKAGQLPNLEDFTAGTDIVKIPSTKNETVDGSIVYRGAMQKLYLDNYERLFAGRGYMQLSINGEKVIVYTPFNKKANVRSVHAIAKAFMADDSEPVGDELRYETLTDNRKNVVESYAANGEIKLMDYELYKENNVFEVVAWNYPVLSETNNYDNEKNRAIATQMKNAGIKVVNLTGKNWVLMDSEEGMEKTRKIINFFWSQGLKTIAFMGVNGDKINSMAVDFTKLGTPDFSDCPGFIGFLHWDEPTYNSTEITEKLAALAVQFDTMYAGTGVAYINNLYPSYASGLTNQATYEKYVEDYCKNVLSKVKGEKWLSVDTYPIKTDKTLESSFLFDLGTIKTYSLAYDAKSHVALQSSGFTGKTRIPSEEEMRMQAYAAMAFGIDYISWFTYSPSSSESETFYTFVDNEGNITDQGAYDAFATVNKELADIGCVYSAFDWKGIILGIYGSNSWVNVDYNAYNSLKTHIDSKYLLSASNTKHLSSVSTNKSLNYLMGVMEDTNGNEGYVLCNYNNTKSDREQTLTLTFDSNITEVVIYRGGVASTESVSNKQLTVALETGEGVIVLPSKLG